MSNSLKYCRFTLVVEKLIKINLIKVELESILFDLFDPNVAQPFVVNVECLTDLVYENERVKMKLTPYTPWVISIFDLLHSSSHV